MMTARCGTVFIWFPNVAGFTESLRSIKKSLDALCIQAFFYVSSSPPIDAEDQYLRLRCIDAPMPNYPFL